MHSHILPTTVEVSDSSQMTCTFTKVSLSTIIESVHDGDQNLCTALLCDDNLHLMSPRFFSYWQYYILGGKFGTE